MEHFISNHEGIKNYMKFVMDFHEDMKKNELILVYEGEVTQSVTKAFTGLTEKNMEQNGTESKVAKKVYHVMVECLQNISKHADDGSASSSNSLADGLSKNGIFVVGRNEQFYSVTTGNSIKTDKIEALKEMIDHINSLDKEEIKALYKKKIKASRLGETGGAGLGFIDLVKKTGNQLQYGFQKLDDENYFFILKTLVTR